MVDAGKLLAPSAPEASLVRSSSPERRALDGELRTISGCTAGLRALGPAPARLRAAQAHAREACGELTGAVALVRGGLGLYRRGLGRGRLAKGAAVLVQGAKLIRQATLDVASPPRNVASKTTTVAESRARADAALVTKRLRARGYVVSKETPGSGLPRPLAELSVRVPGTVRGVVSIYIYASPAQAEAEAKLFDPLKRQHPERLFVDWIGLHLYVGAIEAPRVLPSATVTTIERTTEQR